MLSGFQGGAHPLNRGGRCVLLAEGGRTLEKSRDFAQLLAKFLFCAHVPLWLAGVKDYWNTESKGGMDEKEVYLWKNGDEISRLSLFNTRWASRHETRRG